MPLSGLLRLASPTLAKFSRRGIGLQLDGATSGSATIAPTATGGVTITPQSGQPVRTAGSVEISASAEAITGSLSFTNPGNGLGLLQSGYDSLNNRAFVRSVRWGSSFMPLHYQGSEFTWAVGSSGIAEYMSLNVSGNLKLGGGTASARLHALGSDVLKPVAIFDAPASQTAVHHQYRGISSTAAVREMLDIDTVWTDSTDATRKARAIFRVWDTAAREFMRAEATGSGATVEINGTTTLREGGAPVPSGSYAFRIGSPSGVIPFGFRQDALEGGTPSLATFATASGDLAQLAAGSGLFHIFGEAGKGVTISGNGFANRASGITVTSANAILMVLPTANPAIAGALWNDAGTVKISAG